MIRQRTLHILRLRAVKKKVVKNKRENAAIQKKYRKGVAVNNADAGGIKKALKMSKVPPCEIKISLDDRNDMIKQIK